MARRRSKGKSPRAKTLRRSERNAAKVQIQPKPVTLTNYESPLQCLSLNGPSKSSAESSTIKKEFVDEETSKEMGDKVDKITALVSNKVLTEVLNDKIISESAKEELDDEFSNLTFDFLNCTSIVKEEEEEEVDNTKTTEDINDSSVNATPQTKNTKKRKKKSIHELIRSGEKINFNKKRKLKNKSILSKFKDTPEPNNLIDDSVILLDDSDSENSPTKPLSNEIEQNIKSKNGHSNQAILKPEEIIKQPVLTKPTQTTTEKCILTTPQYYQSLRNHIDGAIKKVVHGVNESNCSQSLTNSEDVIVVDCNDSVQMEMDAYHEKFNQSTNTDPLFSDSVIILDQDDEPPVKEVNDKSETQPSRQEETMKTSEDCFVVWSSLPSTSKTATSLKPQPLFDSNSDMLRQDKILIDTSPDMSNYRCLNNENNKPKKRLMKTSKGNSKYGKHTPFKSILDETKDIANRTAKSAAEVANKVTSKSDNRYTEKTNCKRKAKSSEDLIFLLDKDGQADTTKKPRKGKLREIVIDGSNVGMAYTHNNIFSEKGIQLLIDYFTKKGHVVKVFIPQHRRSYSYPLLEKWYKEGIVVFTPSRKIGNKHFTPYDDRYILEYATACGGVVVSQDQFRDLYREKPQYRDIIENRLLVPTFVGDYVMFPEDPLGRGGPTLSNFLRH